MTSHPDDATPVLKAPPGPPSPPPGLRVGRRTPESDVAAAHADGRMPQGSLLVMAPVRSGRLQDLEKLLKRIAAPESEPGASPPGPGEKGVAANAVFPFTELGTVHFARILIHYPSPGEDSPLPVWNGEVQVSGPEIPAKLLFATDFDGSLEAHLDELFSKAGAGLDAVLGHCEGWPGHAVPAARDFFRRHRVKTNTFYTGTMHRSVSQIEREEELRQAVDGFLDEHAGRPDFPAEPLEVRERVLRWVAEQPHLAWTKVRPGPYPKLLLGGSLPAVAAVAGVALLAVIGAAGLLLSRVLPMGWAIGLAAAPLVALAAVGGLGFAYLTRLSARDPVVIGDGVHDHTSRLVQTEDRIVQNEMSSVIYIKRPLWFRRTVLRLVLAFIDFAAKRLSNQGTLAGIPSIHFARWVVVDGGRRLVFFSNFDGSWENYLGDFIDKAHTGLTAVWSNCVGFPRTRGLTGGGATDEQRFKAYSRQSQIPTQVWYSAYRWLSVSNINDNTRFRLGLYGPMDAAGAEAWLRRSAARARRPLGGNRPAAAPRERVEVEDVQGLVARSFAKLPHAVYVPVEFGDAAAARAWAGALADRLTPASLRSDAVAADGTAVNVAFTRFGLKALGLEEGADGAAGFSREFEEGLGRTQHRNRLLGDTGPADPAEWRWGGPVNPPVHAMLLLYAGTSDALADLTRREAALAGERVRFGTPLDSIMLAGDREHFGFHDGIAQPRIAGLGGAGDEAGSALPPGEVVLGYRNAYGIVPMSPSVPDAGEAARFLTPAERDPSDPGALPRRDLGRNGTYLVFRQIEQDVKAFWRYLDEAGAADPERRKLLGAKMMGRWPNGAPLVRHPDEEPATFDRETANDFWYRDDLDGKKCPVGAHIRRSNPRDGMHPATDDSLLVSDRHRLLRRGRAYGPPLAPSFDPAEILDADDAAGGDRGLHFICFNTDIARQFEFVQSTWINSMKFDGLYQDPDPVAGPHVDPANPPHPEEVTDFTVQRCPVRHRYRGLPRFTTVRGGAYLFMPGIRALRYLATIG